MKKSLVFDPRSQAAIVGIGSTAFVRQSDMSALKLAGIAFKAALADAGLDRAAVDGITTHYGAPLGVDYDRLAEAWGLNTRFAAQYWSHGRFITTSLQHAALAVCAKLADVVVCITAVKFLDARGRLGGDADEANAREGGGSHGEDPAVGLTSPAGGAALAARRYLDLHGLDEGALMDVVLAARAHAARNPRAMRREPFDAAAYALEPMIIAPLRRADCALLSDGAVAVLVTSAERARDCAKIPVYINGMQGMRTGRDEFCFAPRGLGIQQQGLGPPADERQTRQVFEMAGIEPGDVDAFYTYDAFSPLVLFALERFGHFHNGEAASAIAKGAISPGGVLPVNTAGGLLAEAHVAGWNHIAEIVRQVRREAGPTQLPLVRHLQWATAWGDSIIFGPDQ